MNRQSVMVFTCPVNEVAETVSRYAGGFEIISVSHAHLPSGMVSVIVVLHGLSRDLMRHEQKMAEVLATNAVVLR